MLFFCKVIFTIDFYYQHTTPKKEINDIIPYYILPSTFLAESRFLDYIPKGSFSICHIPTICFRILFQQTIIENIRSMPFHTNEKSPFKGDLEGLHEPRPIIRLYPEHLKRILVFRELSEIFLGKRCLYLFLVCWINKSDYCSLEACP